MPSAGDPTALPGAVKVSPRVWKVSFGGRAAFALKLAAPDAPLNGEQRYLRWLAGQGGAVPAVLADAGGDAPEWIALEWCGDDTLDAALQSASPRRAAALGTALVRALAKIEGAFAPFTAQLVSDSARRAALIDQAAPWIGAAPGALEWLLAGGGSHERSRDPSGTLNTALSEALEATLRRALVAAPNAGSLDYHAGNVVVRGRRLTFVDWSAVGLDWPERRLVQYGTATGAGRPAGAFRTAITAAAVHEYARLTSPQRGVPPDEIVQTVDAHDALLLLTAAQQLRLVAEGTADPERTAAWSDIAARRVQLLSLLQRQLAGDGPAEALRRLTRRRERRRGAFRESATSGVPSAAWRR